MVGGVMLPFRDFDHFASKVEAEFWPPYRQIREAKAKKHGEAMQVCADAGIEKPLRCGPGGDRFRRTVALEWQKSVRASDLQP